VEVVYTLTLFPPRDIHNIFYSHVTMVFFPYRNDTPCAAKSQPDSGAATHNDASGSRQWLSKEFSDIDLDLPDQDLKDYVQIGYDAVEEEWDKMSDTDDFVPLGNDEKGWTMVNESRKTETSAKSPNAGEINHSLGHKREKVGEGTDPRTSDARTGEELDYQIDCLDEPKTPPRVFAPLTTSPDGDYSPEMPAPAPTHTSPRTARVRRTAEIRRRMLLRDIQFREALEREALEGVYRPVEGDDRYMPSRPPFPQLPQRQWPL
jgi:hypothetical protein